MCEDLDVVDNILSACRREGFPKGISVAFILKEERGRLRILAASDYEPLSDQLGDFHALTRDLGGFLVRVGVTPELSFQSVLRALRFGRQRQLAPCKETRALTGANSRLGGGPC